jgi:light-regulated signal transduction histidine kinase (bacteriophytochrome)
MIQITDKYDILIVDDTRVNLELLSRILEERGYRVRLATNGRLAMKSVAARLPDLILLDVKMPEMDGFEVCRRLKSDAHSRNVPVIFISAHSETAKKVDGFKAGGVDFITKPFEREEVLARVELQLRLHELTEHLEQQVDQRTRQLRQEIRARQQAEEVLKRYRNQLEELVKNRTKELEAKNKELEAFAYSVSHDLRAPLRHIDGFIELLQKKTETAPDEQGRHYLDLISDSAKKMGALIDDLLSFSRMGRQEMLLKPVGMGPLVHGIIRELVPDTAGRRIDWRIGHLPVVEGDAAMLRMTMDNLISNAIKFTRPRQQAKIEIGSQPGQNGEAVIFVRDNGVGFDMAYAHKLFGVFQRLHRSDEFEGTGIGLANVRRIIARHGGRVWAQGEPGQGAAFFFSLPHTITKGEK